jgi:hypothetical protein
MIASYDWESDSWTQHNGDNLARQAFREAVAAIAEKAKATLPDCIGRVDSAIKIVLNNDVALLPDGTAKVASQSNGTTKYFIVNGECSCKDYPKAPSNWCKHRIAAGLAKRARTLTQVKLDQLNSASNGTTQVPTDQPQAEPTTPTVEIPTQSESAVPLPEAPVSITLKATLHGHEVMVTLRGVDFTSVKAQVEQASEWLSVQSTTQPPTQPPSQSKAQPTHDDSPYCQAHKAVLKRYERNGQVWYSHKLANGQWCRGK